MLNVKIPPINLINYRLVTACLLFYPSYLEV